MDYNFKQSLRLFLDSLESDLIKVRVKEWLVYSTDENKELYESFNEDYNDNNKSEYFDKLSQYITNLNKSYELMKKVSDLDFDSLHNVVNYATRDAILENLDSCSSYSNPKEFREDEYRDFCRLCDFVDIN